MDATFWKDLLEAGMLICFGFSWPINLYKNIKVRSAKGMSLPFILLSDPELQAIKAYDVWQEKKLYGKVSMGVVRTTYVIDEQGMIEKVMPKVKPDTNAAEILAYLAGEK